MEDEKYLVKVEFILPIILDLLVEVNSRQLAMNKVVSEIIADSNGSVFSDILLKIEENTKSVRSNVIQHLYSEFGELHPEIKALLNQTFDK